MHRNPRLSGFLFRLVISSCLAGAVLTIAGSQQQAAAEQPQALTAEAFRADPKLILQRNPTGGASMVSILRDFTVSDRATLQTTLNLVAAGNASQKSAIGAALAQAAKIVAAAQPVYAGQIQQAVARTKDQDVVISYRAVSGDIREGLSRGSERDRPDDRDRSDDHDHDHDHDHDRDHDHRHHRDCDSCPVSP